MRKKILPLGMLVVGLSIQAQVVTFVGDNASLNVKEKALVYSGGTTKVNGTGVVMNEGNFKVDNGGFLTEKTTGENFIIVLNNPNDNNKEYTSYGQLWINNSNQSDLTGYVIKQYKDKNHGQYQQIALPFYNKKLQTLDTELGGSKFTDVRFIGNKASEENILKWNNRVVRQDLVKLDDVTTDPTGYYVLGLKNIDATYFTDNTSNIVGMPVKSGISNTLVDAGKDINFGAGGNATNYYRQRYKHYHYDAWDASNGEWTGDFGRNIYEFGNPYLTNIDLTKLTFKNDIKGIRYEVSGSSTNLTDASATEKFINFTSGTTPVGDVDVAVIKPMQVFTIKLKDNNSYRQINFDDLRTFDSKANNTFYTGMSSVTKPISNDEFKIQSLSNKKVNSSSESVKQLEVIALNEDKVEVDRTYYVVYPYAQTGATTDLSKKSVQVTAKKTNEIGTFEESPEGGVDNNLADTYWLYINEANENDFKGKQIPLVVYSDKIKYLKFNIRENAELLPKGSSQVSQGESFYFRDGNNNPIKISQDSEINIPTDAYEKLGRLGLYYGTPENKNLVTEDNVKAKLSSTMLVLDDADNNYKLLFDNSWKSANVTVYDMTGKVVFQESNVNTNNDYTIKLPNRVKSMYVVEATSETGAKFVKKLRK